MQKHSIVVSVTMIFILVLALSTVALAADPHIGTWKLNLAKSKFNPGPPFKSDTITFTAQNNGIKGAEDLVVADGKAYHSGCAAKYDGKDYPFTGYPDIDTVAFRKINANTFDIVFKKGGKEVSRAREVFSKDGKTLTVTEKGKDAKGQAFNNTYVYDKQ
jgi:hypothetical protein